MAPRAVPPRNRAHSPRPRNVHWFSRLVRKTWRPATMSRCISTRSFRTASIRSPTSSLVSVRRRQCRVSRARGILAPCVARVQNKVTDVSLPRALSSSHFSGVPKCICLIRCIFKARLTQSVDRARDRVENPIVDEDGRLSAIPALCFGSLVSALDSAAPSTETSAEEQRLSVSRVPRVPVIILTDATP